VLHVDQPFDLADHRDDVLETGHACEIKLGGHRLGFLGDISPAGLKTFSLRGPAAVLEIDLGRLASAAQLTTHYAPQSTYPTIARDLNLIVAESVRWSDLASVVRASAGESLERLEYLDTYRDPQKDGPDTKRIHFSFTLRAADRTLTGPEADAIRDAVVTACREQHAAKLLA